MNEMNSQTLFRFVSLRNPDISEEIKKEVRFVYPSENAKNGTFYSAVPEPGSGVSVMSQLIGAATNYRALSREEFKGVDSKLFDFSQWLVQNRSNYTMEELSQAISGVSALEEDEVLWDNLFYQFIVESDFYAKETVIHMIKANHVVVNYAKAMSEENAEKALETLVYATVLLPEDLFKHQTESGGDKALKITAKTFALPETLIADIAAQDLKDLQNVKEEIDELQRTYQSEYDLERADALNRYEKDNKELIDTYNDEVLSAEKDWCSTRGDKPYDTENPNPCDKPEEVKPLQVPEFAFSFRDEIDPKDIQTQISTTAFDLLNRLKPIEKITTFEDAKTTLNKEESRLTSELYNNTTFYNKSISVKGTIIPVAKATVKPS